MLAYLYRAFALFAIGVLFTLVSRIHQIQNNSKTNEPILLTSTTVKHMFLSMWWVPAGCGIAAALVGLLYPCVDKKLGNTKTFQQEWSGVLRCMAIFVGINHASAKLHFSSHQELTLTLAAMSIALWWLCDRTRRGLGLGISTALMATLLAHFVVNYGTWKCTDQDILYYQTWLPCVFFSGGITVGNIGRQLAVDDKFDDGFEIKRRHSKYEH